MRCLFRWSPLVACSAGPRLHLLLFREIIMHESATRLRDNASRLPTNELTLRSHLEQVYGGRLVISVKDHADAAAFRERLRDEQLLGHGRPVDTVPDTRPLRSKRPCPAPL